MPGNFVVKASQHPFLSGESRTIGITALPSGLTRRVLDLKFTYRDLKPVEGAPFVVLFDDGTQRAGTLDAQGEAQVENPPGPGRAFFGYDARQAFPYPPRPANPALGLLPSSPEDARAALERYARAEAGFLEDTCFPDEVAALYSGQADYDDLLDQYDYFDEVELHEHDEDDPGEHQEMLIAGDQTRPRGVA